MLAPQRLPHESFEDYKIRRNNTNKLLHKRLRSGKLLHNARPDINKHDYHNDPSKKGLTAHKNVNGEYV